jgi:anion-transporting  ArsA/GET3 family ATPase
MTRALLVTGSGGVGKTTTAGALAVLASERGAKTLVLTVDPARRLAQALGLDDLHREPHPVAERLDAAMLDPTASWEALIRRHTDTVTAERIIGSRFFRAIADRFPAGQAYAAADEAARIVEADEYDLVVVDTPPFGGGADFFEAPSQVRTLVAGRALRILTGPPIPGRRMLFGLTARPALRLADRVLGGPLLEDLGSFLVDLRSAYDGIRGRAKEVEEIIGVSRSIVVTTPDPGPVAEAHTLLARRRSSERLAIVNRVVPATWIGLGDPDGDPYDVNLHRWSTEALRHQAVAETLISAGAHVVTVLWRSEAPTSLPALADLAHESGFENLLVQA